MWKLLILLFSVAAHASAQSTVPLVAYKKRESGTEVYQYTVGSNGPAPRDFTIVNGENKEDGDFTYIKVFAYAPYEGNYESFNKQYDICIARFSNGLTTHLLSSSGCREALVPEQVPVFSVRQGTTFFASDQKPRRQGVEVFLNQCRDNRNTFTFTKLTTGEASCPSGTNKDFTESFWAYSSGGLACPPKEETIRDGYTTNSDGDVFPNRLTLNCNSGFEVKGTKSVNCEGGRWSGELGGCSRVSCGKPKSPENGNIEGRNYFYEGSILYTCNEGYKLDRPYSQRRDCTSNRQWNPSEEPNCERKSCGSPGDLIYGSMQSNGELFGDIARYRCDEGYKLIGSRQRECKSDGTWTGSKPSCERITCKPLAQPRNGQHDGNAPSKFASGSVVLFKCHEGYKMDGAEILRCQLDSVSESASWSNEAPLCQPIVCKSPAGTSNVDIEGTDYSFGKSIRFRCRDGYNLEGSSIATCNANGWDTEVPSCSAKECNNPGTPDNGKRQGDNFKAYSTVTFSCNNGYQLTPPDSETIICRPTTRWNRPSPICEPVKCPDLPRLENGRLSTELFQYGQNITFECFPGYYLQGNQEITCQANGRWNKDMPQCIRITCGYPGDLMNGTLISYGEKYGDIAEYKCYEGYKLTGSKERQCTEKGTWVGPMPFCKPVNINYPLIIGLITGFLMTIIFAMAVYIIQIKLKMKTPTGDNVYENDGMASVELEEKDKEQEYETVSVAMEANSAEDVYEDPDYEKPIKSTPA